MDHRQAPDRHLAAASGRTKSKTARTKFTNSILIHLDSPRVLVQALLENGGPVAHVNEDVSWNQTYEDDVRTYNAVEPLFAESDIVQADCLRKHV